MKALLSLFTFLTILIILSSCKKNDNTSLSGNWDNSVFIVNEGPFPNGSGTISAYNRESHIVTNNLFETANGRPLGSIVQSMTIYKDKAYIVVNNANKIEVVNLGDFKSDTTIENIPLPRYFVGFNDKKGYISCWDSTVKVISLIDFSLITSIRTGNGPDKMLLHGKLLFVINTGGYETDSTISIIDTDTDQQIDLVKVGDRPSGIQQDANGNIWVLCSGKGYPGYPAPGDTGGRLVCVDPVSFEIIKVISFPDPEMKPENLVIDKNGTRLFYQYPDGIFAFSINDTTLNTLPIITHNNKFYGIGYDKVTKMIMCADPLDYSQNGWVFSYNDQDGTQGDSFMVGVIPSGFCFN
jgi:YVTN family beta-propeller protein